MYALSDESWPDASIVCSISSRRSNSAFWPCAVAAKEAIDVCDFLRLFDWGQ
jgi:hypothetical protein